MTSCAAMFYGGPLDGQVRAFPGDAPPQRVEVRGLDVATLQRQGIRPHDAVPTYTLTYARRISAAPDGPVWRFVIVSDE